MGKVSENWIYIGIGIVVVFIIAIGVFAFSGSSETVEVSTEDLVKKDSHVLGNRDAKVTIVEFSDFKCPACVSAHLVIKQIIAKYGDKILFVYRHFPIVTADQHALKAAEAAEAADEQGKFWEYHDILYANQENLEESDLKKYAKRLGLDMDKFEKALSSGKFKDKVTRDMDDGVKLGVRGTPTFFINGERYQGGLSLDQFKSKIDSKLAVE